MNECLLVSGSGDGCCNGDAAASGASSSAPATVVFSTFVATCGSIAFGCANGFSSPAESGIMDDLGLSIARYSVFGSILTIGAMLGAIISGRVADHIGRKRTMWFLEIICIIGWLSIAFAKDAWWLHFGRFSLGFGVGLQTYVSVVYVAEITPKNIRGVCTAACQLMVCRGVSLMFFFGSAISWHTLALIGTIPCVFQVFGVFFILESPRWLAKVGREKELETALRRLRGDNANISLEAAEIKDSTETFQQLPKSRFLDFFQRKYAHSMIVGIGIGIMLLLPFGGSNGILFYASSIFEAAGCSTGFGTQAMAVIQIPFSIAGVLLMDKCGRRPLLMVAVVGTCLGNFLAGLGFVLQDLHQWKELTATLVLTGILFSSFALGIAGIPWVIMAEIFPINIKGSGGSLAAFVNWFSSWVVSYAFSFLLDWSSAGVFFIFATICASSFLFVAKLARDKGTNTGTDTSIHDLAMMAYSCIVPMAVFLLLCNKYHLFD